MGLFDFLDLEGNTGAWDMASAGANAGAAAAQRDIELRDKLDAASAQDRKLAMDALELQRKAEIVPLEKLQLMQKINVNPAGLNPEPTEEDLMAAKQEIAGDAKSLTEDQFQQAQVKAKEIAAARAVKFDPNDIPGFVNAVSKVGITPENQAEVEKYSASNLMRMQVEQLKAQAAAEKMQKMMEHGQNLADQRSRDMFKALGIKIQNENKNRNIDRGIRENELARKEATKLSSAVSDEIDSKNAANAMRALYNFAKQNGVLDIAQQVYTENQKKLNKGGYVLPGTTESVQSSPLLRGRPEMGGNQKISAPKDKDVVVRQYKDKLGRVYNVMFDKSGKPIGKPMKVK